MSNDSLIKVQPLVAPPEPLRPAQPEKPSPDAVPRVGRTAEGTPARPAVQDQDAARETAREIRRNAESIRETVDRLKEQLERVRAQGYLREIRMDVEVDRESNDIMVKILDARTEKVIREIPPEEQVTFAKKLGEVLGLIFEEIV
ncbi:MAG: hypothetical protein Kow0062_02910 [Acidobacteriota bacterium]